MSLKVDDLAVVFADVQPIPQDDGPSAVARIDYPPDFETAYNYFRGCLRTGEKSLRVFHLTKLCLQFNAANYTVWHYRRQCFQPSNVQEMLDELSFCAQLGGDNPKNYQIWYHRRAILEHSEWFSEVFPSELDYTSTVFAADSKNYHAWCYRQWMILKVNVDAVWADEVDAAHSWIQDDVRNNSAWNQRWFAVHKGQSIPLDDAHVELDYAINQAMIDPYNECPWRYLLAIINEAPSRLALVDEYLAKVLSVKAVLESAGNDSEACAPLQATVVDLLEVKGFFKEARSITDQLASTWDPIREKYWRYRSQKLNS